MLFIIVLFSCCLWSSAPPPGRDWSVGHWDSGRDWRAEGGLAEWRAAEGHQPGEEVVLRASERLPAVRVRQVPALPQRQKPQLPVLPGDVRADFRSVADHNPIGVVMKSPISVLYLFSPGLCSMKHSTVIKLFAVSLSMWWPCILSVSWSDWGRSAASLKAWVSSSSAWCW